MQVLDRTGVGTLWSICKTKFALAGHTHNSLAAVGNEQISATAYGSGLHFKPYYNSGGPTTYGNILEYTSTNTGGGQLAMEWNGSQSKSDGTDSNVGRVYYRSKRDCINGWTKWMTLAYINDIPTKLSQLTNDKGFVTGSVSGNTVTINGVSTTWTNTWRGIQNNLTSTSTSESLSANQGRVLKGLVDGKANSSHTHSWSQISGAPATATRWPSWGEVTGKPTITDNKVTQNAVKSSDYTYWRSLVFSAANSATEGFTPSTTTDGVFIANTLSVQPSSGTIKATKFKGSLEGNASTASNASTVNGHTVNANVPSNAKFTDTNTWRPIQDNLTSSSTSESLSANQGRILKGLIDSKANLSDIPDASNLCRFNFINSISKCQNGRINFFLKIAANYDLNLDIKDFENCEEGTILLLFIYNSSYNDIKITNSAHNWYIDMESKPAGDYYYSAPARILLATIKSGEIYVFRS